MRRLRAAPLPVACVRALLLQILSLFLGIGLLLVGGGVLHTELGLRAERLGFPVAVTGAAMSAFFLGFVLGTFLCPAVIRRAGQGRARAVRRGPQRTQPSTVSRSFGHRPPSGTGSSATSGALASVLPS
jgi:hypothetical protein